MAEVEIKKNTSIVPFIRYSKSTALSPIDIKIDERPSLIILIHLKNMNMRRHLWVFVLSSYWMIFFPLPSHVHQLLVENSEVFPCHTGNYISPMPCLKQLPCLKHMPETPPLGDILVASQHTHTLSVTEPSRLPAQLSLHHNRLVQHTISILRHLAAPIN